MSRQNFDANSAEDYLGLKNPAPEGEFREDGQGIQIPTYRRLSRLKYPPPINISRKSERWMGRTKKHSDTNQNMVTKEFTSD
jgi:hypothetical protein